MITAGCNGLGGQTTQTTDQSEGETTTDQGYPPGAAEQGFLNSTAVLQAHQAAVATADYRLAYNFTNLRGNSVTNTTTIVRSNRTQQRQRAVSTLPRRTLDRYLTANREYVRQNISGQVSYNSTEVRSGFGGVHRSGARPGELLQTTIQSGNFTAVGREQYANQTVIVYNATDTSVNASRQLPNTIQQFYAQVKIGKNGRIWSARLLAAGTTDGSRHVIYQEYKILATSGVMLTTPEWLAKAR